MHNKKLSANAAIKLIMAKLLAEKLAVRMKNVSPDLLVIHPDNRSKLMIDWNGSHGKIIDVKKSGVHIQKLADSVAFELPYNGPIREEILLKNQQKIATSQGRLAPLNGDERYASVASTHVSQGCKAINHGCQTSYEDFAVDGRMSKDCFCRDDPEFERLLAGWDWLILRAECLTAWPELPAFLEKAYNASNNVAKGKDELECISEAVTRLRDGQSPDDVMQELIEAQPDCAGYISAIVDLASEFVESLNVNFESVQQFGLRFGDGTKLGEEYTHPYF